MDLSSNTLVGHQIANETVSPAALPALVHGASDFTPPLLTAVLVGLPIANRLLDLLTTGQTAVEYPADQLG